MVLCLTGPDTPRETSNEVTRVEYLKRNAEYLWNPQVRVQPTAKFKWHLYDAFGGKQERSSLERILGENKFDLIHTNNLAGITSAPWLAAASHRVPMIHTLRDYWLLHPNSTTASSARFLERVVVSLLRWRIKGHSKNVQCVVGISKSVLDAHLSRGFFRTSMIRKVIGNPYGDYGVPESPKKLEGSAGVRLGYLGQITKIKGVENLINCVVPSDGVSLAIGGSGSADYIKKLKESSNARKVNFLGWVESRNFFSTIDVLCVPSLWEEPFGRVVVEAFSCGIPVLTTNKGGIGEIVKDGINGRVCDFGDAQIFQKTLRGMTSPEVYEGLSLNALKTAKRFTKEKIASSYHDLYQKCIESHAKGKADS